MFVSRYDGRNEEFDGWIEKKKSTVVVSAWRVFAEIFFRLGNLFFAHIYLFAGRLFAHVCPTYEFLTTYLRVTHATKQNDNDYY